MDRERTNPKNIFVLAMQKFNGLTIRNKIISFYFVLIVLSILLSAFIYVQTSANYLKQTIYDLNTNEILSDNKSLELLIEDVSNYSKEMLSNQGLQEILDVRNKNLLEYRNLNQELAKSINFNSKISSVYVFSSDGKRYYTEKVAFKKIQLVDIQEKAWYQEIIDKHGGFYYNFNADGLIDREIGNYLTFFRVINSIYDHKPIGLMVINIEEKVVRETLNIQENSDLNFVIEELDQHTMMNINPKEAVAYDEYPQPEEDNEAVVEEKTVNGENLIISGYVNSTYGWRLTRTISNNGQNKMDYTVNIAVLGIILINGVLIIIGSFFISRYITNPIYELIDSMKDVEQGNFYPVDISSYQDEIGQLKEGYNYMIIKIQELINTVIEEQKTLKKSELRVIMEQIKPHFMYNTLDSISSLVMMDRKSDAYDSLRALSRFYHSSLSDGRFIITIRTELEIIKNYLFIQKIRYQDLFEVTYDVDDSVLEFKVPKLILQPLVENSIYHGLRPLGEGGSIHVAIKDREEYVELVVEDTGAGMTEQVIESLKSVSDNSVGIPATINRIKRMYGELSQFEISSDVHKGGTKITIRLPRGGEINENL